MTSPSRIVGFTLIVAVAATVVVLGKVTGILYALLFLLSLAPGFPLGFLAFGARHAGGWILGAVLGYAASCLSIWSVIYLGKASTPAFVIAWAFTCAGALAAAWLLGARDRPLLQLPRWTRRDTTALLLILLLVPALVGRPFARIGSVDENGDKRYRAYFTADFVWHTALTAELRRHASPPVNPYLAPEPIHYYWTYFLVPAAAGPMVGSDIELSLEINAVGAALMLMAAIFLATWVVIPTRPFVVAGAVAIVTLAASLEGVAAIAYVFQQHQGISGLRDLNVDALSRGVGGLRIDNLPRAMWYTPQHSMSYALGVSALPIAAAGGLAAPLAATLLAGLALGASVAFNPFVGGLLCLVYAAAILGRWRENGGQFSAIFRHALAVVPVIAALAWGSLNQVADGAGGTLHLGLYGPARNSPLIGLALSFGPLLVMTAIGLLRNARLSFWRVWPALSGVVLVLLVMHLVTMTVDEFWIGFRTGHLFFVLVPPIVARGLVWLEAYASPQVAPLVVAGVVAAGLPTTVIDAFNAQDVENTHQGIGLNWVLRLSPEEQEGLAWIKANTPQTAVVQAEPMSRGRDTWSLIPSFAERRMAAGQPISLMHVSEYDSRSETVQRIYAFPDAERAWRDALSLGIDYLWVDRVERIAYTNVAKFEDHPDWFAPVFRNREVTIYHVIRDGSARTSGTR